jgi:hypothetical protein
MSVLLPVPFSPMRKVTPGGISRPSFRISSATAGIVKGQRSRSGGDVGWGLQSTRSRWRTSCDQPWSPPEARVTADKGGEGITF